MLIYVIPFVILLIVLVVLKKRQDAQGSDKTTAATPKAKAKKAGSSARAAPNKTQPVQDPAVQKKQTTPLSDDVRSKIESLTQERNFFSAEAQINQALKKDNTQHELYLYLLDIHILQKDEFAISQLLNHLRSLELDSILQQAEAKKADFDKSQNAADEAIAFTRTSFSPEPVPEAPKAQNNADFDALMTGAPAAETKASLAFDQLHLDPAPQAAQPAAKAAEEIKPLDFSFAVDAPEPAEAPQAAAPLNFELASLEAPAAEPAAEAPAAPAGVSFDLGSAGTPAIPAADKSDPLLQSFPELAEVNEAALNLELAQQYIELGSFDAARDLLAEKEAEYSLEQRQQADLLLNQIAS